MTPDGKLCTTRMVEAASDPMSKDDIEARIASAQALLQGWDDYCARRQQGVIEEIALLADMLKQFPVEAAQAEVVNDASA